MNPSISSSTDPPARQRLRTELTKLTRFAAEVLATPDLNPARTTFVAHHRSDLEFLRDLGTKVEGDPSFGTLEDFEDWTERALRSLRVRAA